MAVLGQLSRGSTSKAGRWWGRTHRGIGLVFLPIFGVVLVVIGIIGHDDAQPFRGGTTTTGTFSDVTEHTTYSSHGGRHHHYDAVISYTRTDGEQDSFHVSTASSIHDGGTAEVSYVAGRSGARWVGRGADADGGLIIGIAVLVVSAAYAAWHLVARRRRRFRGASFSD